MLYLYLVAEKILGQIYRSISKKEAGSKAVGKIYGRVIGWIEKGRPKKIADFTENLKINYELIMKKTRLHAYNEGS